MSGKGLEIVRVRCQDSAGRFCMRHDERVDRGTAPSTPPEQCSTSGEHLG